MRDHARARCNPALAWVASRSCRSSVAGAWAKSTGRDTRLGRDVALKLLSPDITADRDAVRRFEQEARAASGLNHPAIVTIFDAGEQEGTVFIVSELLDGRTLRERLTSGQMTIDESLEIAAHAAAGLAAALKNSRDVTPTARDQSLSTRAGAWPVIAPAGIVGAAVLTATMLKQTTNSESSSALRASVVVPASAAAGSVGASVHRHVAVEKLHEHVRIGT